MESSNCTGVIDSLIKERNRRGKYRETWAVKRRKSIDQNANRRRNQSNKVTLEKRHSFIVWFRKRTRIPGPLMDVFVSNSFLSVKEIRKWRTGNELRAACCSWGTINAWLWYIKGCPSTSSALKRIWFSFRSRFAPFPNSRPDLTLHTSASELGKFTRAW